MTQNFWLPIKFPGLNDYIAAMNSNRHTGNQMKQQYTNAVKLLVQKDGNRVRLPVHITFIWHEENAKRDPDNIIFAKKFILDGLVAGSVLPNDTQQWVYGFADSWVAAPPKRSKVKVSPIIEPGVMVRVKEIV